MGSFVWIWCFLPGLWPFNCQKLCLFCNFLADVSKKSKDVIAIYVYASESSRFALLEKKILTFEVNEFC